MENTNMLSSNSAIASEVIKLEKKYPNNMDLGFAIRKLLLENREQYDLLLKSILNKKG
jgi:hypothetical protein